MYFCDETKLLSISTLVNTLLACMKNTYALMQICLFDLNLTLCGIAVANKREPIKSTSLLYISIFYIGDLCEYHRIQKSVYTYKKIKYKGGVSMEHFFVDNSSDEKIEIICNILKTGYCPVEYQNEEDINCIIEWFMYKLDKTLHDGLQIVQPPEVCHGRFYAVNTTTSKYHNKSIEEKMLIKCLIRRGYNNSQISRMTKLSRRTIANIRLHYFD